MIRNFFVAVTVLMAFCVNLFASQTVKLSTGATLEIFTPDASKANGCAVIICPGGGYAYLADAKEGTDCAPFFNKLGYTIAVLRYRLPKTKHEVPLTDGRAALQYLRDHADELMLFPNRIGVMGFSAGGHLASTIATHTEGDERPAFQILFYPVITMEKGKTHQGSIDELLGKSPSAELVEEYSNQKHVDAAAPPAYITYSDNDGTVPPATNGKLYYDALVGCSVPVTLKTFPTGGHGWGLAADKLGSKYMSELHESFTEWLSTTLPPLLPQVEINSEQTTITIEAEEETIPSLNILRYPNVRTIVINSPAVASKSYSKTKTLLSYLGDQATEYIFGEGVTKIGRYILLGSEALQRLQLPSTLQEIGAHSFNQCKALKTIECSSTVPPQAGASFVTAAQKANITLRVPTGSRTAYEASEDWSGFAAVEEFEPTAVSRVLPAVSRQHQAYCLDGRPAVNRRHSIVVVNGKKIVQ